MTTEAVNAAPPENVVLKDQLNNFWGAGDFYKHWLGPIIYSCGVKYLADNAAHGSGAYWLIDAIASHITANPAFRRKMQRDPGLKQLQFWKLKTNLADRTAVLTCRKDSGIKPCVRQEIEHTDFDIEEVDIWAGDNGRGWTLYLPCEH